MINYQLDFPLLKQKYKGQSLVYFDNAATHPKPKLVLKAIENHYKKNNANVHRGLNFLTNRATNAYEEARNKVANLISASAEEIIFTSGTTMSLNLITKAWGENNLQAGDVVVLSQAEHHANIVPWLQLREKIAIDIVYIPLKSNGLLDMIKAKELLAGKNVKVLSITAGSNVLGISYDLKDLIYLAKNLNIITIVDAAQAVAHEEINIADLACDFLAFSGHKIGATEGIGVLYIKRSFLEDIPTFLGGGAMIAEVLEQSFIPVSGLTKLEAGTPNIIGAVSLGSAIDYIQSVSYLEIKKREDILTKYLIKKLATLYFVKILGANNNSWPIFSLKFTDMHPHDVADLLGESGIIVRAGHHCAQVLHDSLKVSASLRLSLSYYNTKSEIDYFIKSMKKIHKILA